MLPHPPKDGNALVISCRLWCHGRPYNLYYQAIRLLVCPVLHKNVNKIKRSTKITIYSIFFVISAVAFAIDHTVIEAAFQLNAYAGQ